MTIPDLATQKEQRQQTSSRPSSTSSKLGHNGTVRNALTRLLADEHISRKWDGKERFGRYTFTGNPERLVNAGDETRTKR